MPTKQWFCRAHDRRTVPAKPLRPRRLQERLDRLRLEGNRLLTGDPSAKGSVEARRSVGQLPDRGASGTCRSERATRPMRMEPWRFQSQLLLPGRPEPPVEASERRSKRWNSRPGFSAWYRPKRDLPLIGLLDQPLEDPEPRHARPAVASQEAPKHADHDSLLSP